MVLRAAGFPVRQLLCPWVHHGSLKALFFGFPFWRLSLEMQMTWRVIWFHDVSCQNSGVFVLGSSLNCLKKQCWFVVSIMFDFPSLLIWHSWPHLFLGWVDVPGWNFIASLTCLGGVWRPETDLPDRIAFGPWVSHAIPRLTWNQPGTPKDINKLSLEDDVPGGIWQCWWGNHIPSG